MQKYIAQFIFVGTERTEVIKKNILGSFGIKGLSILTSLVLVPFTINLLNQEKYGIWMTIFSIVTWFNMTDIGMGNGFRIKFANARALGKNILAKEYVQTIYSSMAIIALFSFSLFTAINSFLDWHKILNLKTDFDENINLIVWSVFALFCLQLYLKNISTILLALQKTTYSNALILIANVGALIFIFILHHLNMISLFSIALAFMTPPILVFLIASLLAFNWNLKEFKPKLFYLPKKKYFNDLIGLGLKFFIIQITTVVMFSSSNIIITQLYGPSKVTPYDVGLRLFSSALTIFTIIVTPFWSAFTEAYAIEDFNWIKKAIKKLMTAWVGFSLGIIVLWLISPHIYQLWVGKEVIISWGLSFQFALFVILMARSSIFSAYLAGIGKISISLYGAIFQCIVNIPLAIFLAKDLKLNTTGIIMATNINLLLGVILLSIQTKKIINNKAYGIWNR